MNSTVRKSWLSVLLLLASTTAPLNVAYAHGTLRRSVPAKDEHLSAVPRDLRLTFTEAVELTFARLSLVGPRGAVPLGPLVLVPDSATVLIAPITGPLIEGAYTVRWQVAGADGHPVRGEYTFFIAPGAGGLATLADDDPPVNTETHHDPTTFPESSSFSANSPLYAVIRWATFVALLGVIGAIAFRIVLKIMVLQRSPAGAAISAEAGTRAAVLGFSLAVGLLVIGIVRLIAQSYALHGGSNALDTTLIAAMLTRTVWGTAWLLQLAGTAVVLVGFLLVRRTNQVGWLIAASGAVILAFTPGLSGHATATERFAPLPVITDALHVIGAAGWLGSLLFVIAVGVPVALRLQPGTRAAAIAALVNAFSPTALFFAGLTVATGVFAAWLHLETIPALWESAYGRTLLVKLAVLTGVFGTGAYNWLRVKPALGEEVATSRLRRSATFELAVGIVVLAVTAVLVATGTPAAMPDDTAAVTSTTAR